MSIRKKLERMLSARINREFDRIDKEVLRNNLDTIYLYSNINLNDETTIANIDNIMATADRAITEINDKYNQISDRCMKFKEPNTRYIRE